MPCLSTGYDEDNSFDRKRIKSLQKDVDHLEAALCRALTFIEDNSFMKTFLSTSDWAEAGISAAQVTSWWKSHKKKDAARHERELLASQVKAANEALYLRLSSKSWRSCSEHEKQFLHLYARVRDIPWSNMKEADLKSLKSLHQSISTEQNSPPG